MCDRPKENVAWNKKKLVSSNARPNPVDCDIYPNRFNSHFINIAKNLDSNLNKPGTILWKGPKSRYVLNFIIYLSKISNFI